MKYPFDLDNFESFLSEQADQHRMYASDSVWRNIQENLHGKDRWPALTFASLLTASIIAIVLTLTYPNRNLLNSPADYSALSNKTTPKAAETAEVQLDFKNITAPSAALSVSSMVVAVAANESRNTGKLYNANLPVDHDYHANSTAHSDNDAIAIEANNENEAIIENASIIEKSAKLVIINKTNPENNSLIEVVSGNNFIEVNTTEVNNNSSITPPVEETLTLQHAKMQETTFIKTTMEYSPEMLKPAPVKPSPWSLQIYGTPSVSYRYLLEDKKFDETQSTLSGPLAPYLTNSVNEFIIHKPKMGLEVGAALLYQVADNFRLKTGMQLNYRQFGIQGFATSFQPAMLALNRGNGIDSIMRYSTISTQEGYRELNLTSNFLELAIPIGFDLKMANIKNVDFYMSAAGQLTYQISSNNYILSADYKNYLQQPDLERRFNINTVVEAFASFEVGGVTWQAGPQIRYQLLPGSKNAYPIREHLVDYGFKIGIVKPIK